MKPARSLPWSTCAALTGAALAILAPTAAAAERVSAKRAAMTPGHVHAQAVIIDDALEVETVISTETADRSARGLFGAAWNDNHLRAMVDKRTGAARFEVRQTLHYNGAPRGFGAVHYQTAAWPVTAPLKKLADNAAACTIFDASGVCFEQVAFEVDEAGLRQIAAAYRPNAADQWAFKFKADAGEDRQAAMMRAEVVGLLRAVDAYKQGLGRAPVAAGAIAARASAG